MKTRDFPIGKNNIYKPLLVKNHNVLELFQSLVILGSYKVRDLFEEAEKKWVTACTCPERGVVDETTLPEPPDTLLEKSLQPVIVTTH